jgi:hypothetical protein
VSKTMERMIKALAKENDQLRKENNEIIKKIAAFIVEIERLKKLLKFGG